MTQRTCAVNGCPNPHRARGWCQAHYMAWYKYGDPLTVRPERWDGYVRPRCSVDGCAELAHARGMCASHFFRTRRWGDPLAGRRNNATGTPEERFWSFVDVHENGCWYWNGGLITGGYALFYPAANEHVYAHRWSYEHFTGPITEEALDHLCHTFDLTCPGGVCIHRSCVNPEHLEPVTHVENLRRGHERARLRRIMLANREANA